MAAAGRRSNGSGAGASQLPARRMEGRRIVVVLGASESGLSLLSRTLHALGVDMLEGDSGDVWNDGRAQWRRPWISDLHQQLLSAIDRLPSHPAHPLPFPPGWWRRPAVQAIRREMTSALEAALEDQTETWGFADVTTARLLPVWSEVFERLGLQPEYIWALTHPGRTEPGNAHRKNGRPSGDIQWFSYSADVYRYAGERLAAVVEENAWRDDPQALLDKLLGRLHLRWRGTRLDLFETISGLLESDEEEDEPQRRAPPLPISLALYEAAAQSDDDPAARERLATLVEGAELLRPMIAPFLPLADGRGQPAAKAAELEREVQELRATCDELRRQLNGSAGHAPTPNDERLAALELELEARSAETRWLHDQYRERMEELEAEASALRAQGRASEALPAAGHPASEEELASAHAEIQRLASEMRNLNNANERYLARIYELKKALEERGGL